MYWCITLYYQVSMLYRGQFKEVSKEQTGNKQTKTLTQKKKDSFIFFPLCRSLYMWNHFPLAEIFNKSYATTNCIYTNWIFNYRIGRRRLSRTMSQFFLQLAAFFFISCSSNFCHLLFSLGKFNLKLSNQFKSNKCSDLWKKMSMKSVPMKSVDDLNLNCLLQLDFFLL